MFSEQRKAEIVKQLEKDGSINVNVLAERFCTSKETIRKDLNELERQGVLTRTHGGAVLENRNREYPVMVRGIQETEAKKRICKKAASFIAEGDTLFVDNSSTMLYLPQYIPAQLSITILTNSINFLLETAKMQNHNWLIICLGGILNQSNFSVYGSGALKCAEEYYPSKTFFSCAGVSAQNKVADSSLHEIEVKRMMISRAQQSFLLADATKFKKAGQIFLCGFDDVDCIVTNCTEPAASELMSGSGVKVVHAS